MPSEGVCLLCNDVSETCDHLFIHCSMARKLWTWWLRIWSTHWCFPLTSLDAFHQWAPPRHGNFIKKVWIASFIIIMWTLWRERNTRCFENTSSSLSHLQNLVLLRLGWWIKGWGDPFPYNPNEIVRNPSCLDWSPQILPPQTLGFHRDSRAWSPPIFPIPQMEC